MNFLIDSGSVVSLHSRDYKHLASDTPILESDQLLAVNHTDIEVFGKRTMRLTINDIDFSQEFIIADVGCSILGFDFIEGNGFTIETKPLKLVAQRPKERSIGGTTGSLPIVRSVVSGIIAEFSTQTESITEDLHAKVRCRGM